MLVSVIITSYNYARYLERAIRSALSQSLETSSYEVIVVDDCSQDETSAVLDNYLDSVKQIRLDKNVGLSAARNIGIKKARGQYVVFLDADDYLHHDILYVQKLFLEMNSNIDAVSCDYFLVDEKGTHIKQVNAEEMPIACAIMFRKDYLFDIGLYDENFRAREEEDLRARFLKKFKIFNIILPLYRYRMHDNNLTKNEIEMDKYAQQLKDKHE
jgi:glycosyltransferase involved in cell wall biosynthesis